MPQVQIKGKYDVKVAYSQGAVIGDGNTVHQTYHIARPQVLRQVAPPPPARLFGRDELVAELANLLLSDSCPPIIGLWGLPGVGIGALLRYIAHQRAIDEKFADGCLWIDVQQAQNETLTIFRRLATNLGQDPNIFGDLSSIKNNVRAALAHKSVLLVFNNVSQQEMLIELTGLARIGQTVVIITTHQRELAAEFAEHSLKVPPLSPEAAAQLLRYHAQLSEDAHIEKLIAKTAGLPLLISTTGRRLRTKCPDQKEREIRRLITELPDPAEQLELAVGVIPFHDALLLNYNAASAPAQRILRLLGLLSPDSVTIALVAAMIELSPDRTIDLLIELVDLNLLEEVADDTYRLLGPVHLLAADLARQALDSESLVDQAITYFTTWIEDRTNMANIQDLQQYETQLTHYMALFEVVLSLSKWEALYRLSDIENRPVTLGGNITAIHASPMPLALVRATFENSYLNKVDLRGALFEDLHITNASCQEIRTAASVFRDIHANESLLHNIDLRASRLRDMHLSNCGLVEVNLHASVMRDIYLDYCQTTGIDLRNAKLRDLHISHSHIAHVQLDGATIGNIHVSKSILVDMGFTQASFEGLILDEESIMIDVDLPTPDQADRTD